jgi:hypothetical protein
MRRLPRATPRQTEAMQHAPASSPGAGLEAERTKWIFNANPDRSDAIGVSKAGADPADA